MAELVLAAELLAAGLGAVGVVVGRGAVVAEVLVVGPVLVVGLVLVMGLAVGDAGAGDEAAATGGFCVGTAGVGWTGTVVRVVDEARDPLDPVR